VDVSSFNLGPSAMLEVMTVGPAGNKGDIDVQPCRKAAEKSTPNKILITLSLSVHARKGLDGHWLSGQKLLSSLRMLTLSFPHQSDCEHGKSFPDASRRGLSVRMWRRAKICRP
jgi:hypothetical protein